MRPTIKPIYLIIGIAIVILVVLAFVSITIATQKNKIGKSDITPTVGQNSIPKISPTNVYPTDNNLTPTEPPHTFTGVNEPTFPPITQSLIDQKEQLRSKLPVKQATFTITYDYSEDMFDVQLTSPKDQSRKDFEQWLQKSYPAIPLDRFITH